MDPDGRDSVPSLMINGQAEGMCLQNASGACQFDSGAAVHDGEKSWLASNTPNDKSKRGAERGAAAAAAFNATQAARPRVAPIPKIAGMEEVVVDQVIPVVEELLPGVGAEAAAIESEADGIAERTP